MEDEICLNCWHFPVCYINIEARRQELWNKDDKGILEFYTKSAHDCDYFEPYKEWIERIRIQYNPK